MLFLRAIGLVAGVWTLLLGIGWLAGAIPPEPRATTANASAYSDPGHESEAETSAGRPVAPANMRQRVGSAADYRDPGTSPTVGSAADYADPAASPTEDPEDDSAYDGPWEESVQCDALADVSDLRALTDKRAILRGLAERRYPPGVAFIEAMDDNALNTFAQGETFDDMVRAFDVVVHEGSHLWAARRFRMSRVTYAITPEDIRPLRRFPTFVRSSIVSSLEGPPNDSYVSVYLEGDSGDQGFETLLDELNAYVHSLASATCIRDLYPPGQSRSARDGILAMLYYVGTYLRVARLEHPEIYTRIRANDAIARFIVDEWERAHYWLAQSAAHTHLGIRDREYSALVHAPRITSEFEMVRRVLE